MWALPTYINDPLAAKPAKPAIHWDTPAIHLRYMYQNVSECIRMYPKCIWKVSRCDTFPIHFRYIPIHSDTCISMYLRCISVYLKCVPSAGFTGWLDWLMLGCAKHADHHCCGSMHSSNWCCRNLHLILSAIRFVPWKQIYLSWLHHSFSSARQLASFHTPSIAEPIC